jgi:flagellar biosynthesis protein FlhF
MAEAMAMLRAELGEDAVILSTRRVAGGVELTAAQETEDEPLVIAPDAATPTALPPELRRHNMPPALAQRLAGAPLRTALAQEFRFARLPLDPGPLLLAGPPGAGKTLSAAKLATRLVLAGTPPLLVTADGRRAGAAEQLAAFARVLDLSLAVANTPASLAKALARRAPGQPALVDMPGCDPFDAAAARRHAALADAVRGSAGAARWPRCRRSGGNRARLPPPRLPSPAADAPGCNAAVGRGAGSGGGGGSRADGSGHGTGCGHGPDAAGRGLAGTAHGGG